MNSLYPIIRRVRRALLPPDDIAPAVPPAVVEPSPAVPPVVTVPVEPVVLENVADSQSSSLPGDDQSLLTSAAMGKKAAPHPGPLPDRGGEGGDNQSLLTSAPTKAMKGKREAAKSRVKAADEAHSTQP